MRRTALIFGVLAIVLGAGACADPDPDKRAGSLEKLVKTGLAGPRVTFKRTEAFGADRHAVTPLDLWKPFRYECTFGSLEPERPIDTEETVVAMELISRGGPTPEEFSLAFGEEQGGLVAFASARDEIIGNTFFAGAEALEGILEHDGSNLLYRARPAGSAEAFTLVATLPFAAQMFPLNPAIFAGDIGSGTEVGFDRMRVPVNAAPPAPVGARHAAMNVALDVVASLAEARYALTASPPDIAAAALHFGAAETSRAALGATLPGLGLTEDERRAAEKGVEKSAKSIAAAAEALDRKGARGISPALKKVSKSLFFIVQAGDAVLSEEFRTWAGGQTLLR